MISIMLEAHNHQHMLSTMLQNILSRMVYNDPSISIQFIVADDSEEDDYLEIDPWEQHFDKTVIDFNY